MERRREAPPAPPPAGARARPPPPRPPPGPPPAPARREREPDAAPRAAAEGSGSPECGVVTCDPDGRIVAVNRHARLLLGDAERAATGADGPLGRALRGEEHVSGVRLEVAAGAGTV